jgi:AP-4 complex subunit mu-1
MNLISPKNIEGITYVYMKKKGLFLVCTTRTNGSPSYMIEILGRVCKVPTSTTH